MPHHAARVTLASALSPDARLLLTALLKALNERLVPLGLPPFTLEELHQEVKTALQAQRHTEKSVL